MKRTFVRRDVLAILSTLTAGCLSGGRDGQDGSPNGTSDDGTPGSGEESGAADSCGDSTMESPSPYPDVSLRPDPVTDSASVDVCVEAVEPFTDEHPARIAVALTNEADSEQTFDFTVSPPYPPYPAEHEDAAAELLPIPDYREYVTPRSGEFVPEAPTDGCWRALERPGGLDAGISRTIAPGETLREEYALLAAPDGECLAPGTYRTEVDSYHPTGGDPWGFEIELSE